uniref:GHMP kinase N-terminal domain-containing protein n=1 Tax=Grammatophora oceanica TaxID=210454 RepID=A0A7S1UXN7_9STRA|eukprot:CAMPEP_0194036640 /NCGR_PEP_ID=MMETSP0009_2-20130614/9006_1 /TAXON_ID=210454 /ORGANISM="Grammatophora oceanica, Strain CCMP 410" /LENGTH=391 /DNA_ID=CAMNT_0038678483 /DNA_START=13 /DNA_END=1188 /DNA_ORIENTATION=+
MTVTPEEHELFVPGRICLFGEHSDWAGGYRKENPDLLPGQCLISGTDQGLYARVKAHPSSKLVLKCTLHTGQSSSTEIEWEDLLSEATSANSHWSYICGVIYQIQKRYPQVGGIVLDNYKTTLPVKKGLSSSAAVCVLTARAYNVVYDLGLSLRDEMELAYLGETTTPSKCGRMDQGCAYGQGPILMEFDGDDLNVKDDVILNTPIHLILVDLQAHKDTPSILRDLRKAYPKPSCEVTEGVQKLFGRLNHEIMKKALGALEVGCAKRVGELMTEAQHLFDRYAMPASQHLTSPVLHKLLSNPALRPHVYGGKGVGSQGDGSAQFVAKSEEHRRIAINIIEQELGMSCLPLTLGKRNCSSEEESQQLSPEQQDRRRTHQFAHPIDNVGRNGH